MKKILILVVLAFLANAALFSAENGVKKAEGPKTFTFSQTNLNQQDDFTRFESKKSSSRKNGFMSTLEKNSDTFLYLAIGFTIGSGVALTLGIVGSALWGMYYYTPVSWGALYAGYVLTGIGWGLFPLLFIAAIVFWVFYALPKISGSRGKNAMRFEPIDRGFALSVKL